MKVSYLFFILLFCLNSFSSIAQNFGLESDTVFSTGAADDFTFYLPNDFYNNSGEDLQLRWVKEEVIEEYGHGNETGLWDYTIQDPQTFHDPGEDVDSSDFVLQANIGSLDKFIIQVYPNGNPGNIFMSFRIYEIGNPSNFFYVYIDYTATSVTSISTLENMEISISPNPTADFLKIDNKGDFDIQYSLLDISGKVLIENEALSSNDVAELDVTMYSSGIYIVQILLDGKLYSKRVSIK